MKKNHWHFKPLKLIDTTDNKNKYDNISKSVV